MKKAKLLSLFLAGCLLFQTAGIDALATAPAEPAPISETVENTDNGLVDQSADGETADQPSDEGTDKTPTGEPVDSDQPSDEDTDKAPTEDQVGSDQPSDEDADKAPVEDQDGSDQSSDEETDKDPAEEDVDADQPSNEETEGDAPVEDTEENNESVSENTVSENTVSENTVSENTLPEKSETSIFSIFPGLGENYQFTSQEIKDKQLLASHVDDIVQVQSAETATIEDYQDAEGKYALGEVVYLAKTLEEAERVAAAFGGTLQSYSYEVAVIDLPRQATVALAVAAAADSEIKLPAVWPNYYNYLYTEPNATVNPLTPSDSGYVNQWFHDYIGTRYAWAAGYKGQGIKVAVIDTGLTRNHEDLANNAVDGRTFVNGANGTPENNDNDEHGTHVAGIIAADDNGIGVVGVAPDATIRGYSVFAANGSCKTAWIISAIKAAVQDGNDIINMSLGSPSYDGNYEKAVNDAYNAGVAIFAASGNDDTDAGNFPAAYAGTISIGAVDENSARASFSCYGKTVALAFPGVDIYSTIPTGYDFMDGTSMACPAAAGTAAVILSARDDIRNKEGKAKVTALLSAMKSSTTKCTDSGMGAGTTYLPGVLKLATDMTAPETPMIEVADETTYQKGTNNKDYIAESLQVTISTKTAVGVDIYYSTTGKVPTYKNGAITNADSTEPYRIGDKITLTGAKSKTIKAIAVNPYSGKVSKVASKTVTLTPIPTKVTVEPVSNVKRIVAGKSLKFTATVEPSYAISNKVGWSVDAQATAAGITVTNGTVKTKPTTAAGTYTVTATAVGSTNKTNYNGKSDTFTFTVIASSDIKKVAFIDSATNKAPTPKSIKTTDSKTTDAENSAIIDLGNYLVVTKTDNSTVTGATALAEVVWSSSNTKIATVKNGVITAKAPGKATIKATSNDGVNKSASYVVTVVEPVAKITISGPKKVAAGKGIALTAKIAPANASNKKVEWTVDGDGNMKINKNNGKITTTASASGTYTVTAKAADGLIAPAATYQITIVSGAITKITLNKNKLTLFPPNTSASVSATTATLTPDIASTGAADTSLISWTSSAPSIASVKDGVITAKAPGKATITCAAIDGSNKKATCAVTVSVPMSKLVVGAANGNMGLIAVGKKVKMTAKYYSNYGTPSNKKVKWEIVGFNSQAAADALSGKVTIANNGTVSVDKSVTLPSNALPSSNSYAVGVRAVAMDGSGVVSETFPLIVTPNFAAIKLEKAYTTDEEGYINGYHFIVLATTQTKNGKPDWGINDSNAILLPGYYCTANISGPKNIGLDKDALLDGSVLYDPHPIKETTKQLDLLGRPGGPALYTNECDKITLTVTLKDGSNLKAKDTRYAVWYRNQAGYWVVGYYKN